eukprot:6152632-Pleurochrysis_carterae.AAC.2
MDEHANRVLAYMAQSLAQSADEGIEFKPGGKAELIAYSDSDWAVARSTTGFCVTFGQALQSLTARSVSTASRCHPPRPRSSPLRTLRLRLSTCGACWQRWDMNNYTRPRCTSTTAERSSCPRSAA